VRAKRFELTPLYLERGLRAGKLALGSELTPRIRTGMQQDSSRLQAHAFRSFLLACGLAALVLLSVVAVAGACRVGSSSRPGKAPSSVPASRVNSGPPRTTAPKSAPIAKACPASARYNPKTARCDSYRF